MSKDTIDTTGSGREGGRGEQQEASPPQQEQRPVVTLWKDIREYLEQPPTDEDDGAAGRNSSRRRSPAPLAVCPICDEQELAIGGVPPSRDDAERLPAVVLVCGHMGCAGCLETWFRACSDAGRRISCPVCRHELHHAGPDCGHLIKPYCLPQPPPPPAAREGGQEGQEEEEEEEEEEDDDDDEQDPDGPCYYLRHLPRTLPEGGSQPERCNDCRVKRAEALARLLEREVEKLKRSLLQREQDRAGLGRLTPDEVSLFHDVRLQAENRVLANLHRVFDAEYPSWGGDVRWQ